MDDTPEKKAPSGLAQRAVTGVALALIALVIIWLPALTVRELPDRIEGGPDGTTVVTTVSVYPSSLANLAFALLATAFVALGFREYAAMARAKGLVIETAGGTVAVVLVLLAAALTGPFGFMAQNAIFFLAVALLAWLHILRGMTHHTLPGLAATAFGVLYLGWMPAHLVLMHVEPGDGPGLVTMLLAMVALSDTGAYFTGRAIGRHKLAPHTSPKKTWEGAFGGLIAAMLTGAAIYALRNSLDLRALPEYPLWWCLATGAVLSVVSQIGDLVESMLKRDAGVKDSGTIFPGHGGVLDRCDGIIFAAPALYYLLLLEKGLY